MTVRTSTAEQARLLAAEEFAEARAASRRTCRCVRPGCRMPPPGPKLLRRASVPAVAAAACRRARSTRWDRTPSLSPDPLEPLEPFVLMPRPPGRSAIRRSRRRSGTSRAARRGVPRPMISPSSSTRIWSASTIVDTRWATISTAASAVCGLERCPQAGVGGEVERRERVVEHVDLRLHDECSGDAQSLALTARHVRAALGDRAVDPVGHGLHEVGWPARPRAPPTARHRSASGRP